MRFSFIIFAVFLLLAFVPEKTEHKVYWADKKLSWSDFKGPKQISYYAAKTFTELGYSLSMNNDSVTVDASCYFNVFKSWTTADTSNYLLNHEQRHFDIAEYSIRNFREDLLSINFRNKNQVQKDISNLFESQLAFNTTLQATYDKESDHSINVAMQEVWNAKIDSMLIATQNFTKSKIVLYIGDLK